MSISPRQMWTNMAAATNSRAATLEQLANVPTKSGGGGEKSTPIDRVALESVKIVAQS